jgi:hypothetical protein
VTTIGAKRPDTLVAVILGVDTHFDFYVAVAVDQLNRETWASRACQRLQRATRGFSIGRSALVP